MSNIHPLFRMRTVIDKQVHYMGLIEYESNKPVSCTTISYIDTADKPYWRPYQWDIFFHKNDKTQLYLFNSGSGGSVKELFMADRIQGCNAKYWIAPYCDLKAIPQNAKRIKQPLPINISGLRRSPTSINPFKLGNISYYYQHCESCGLDYNDGCPWHYDA